MAHRGLITTGLLVIVLALIWLFLIFPGMVKMPEDYEQEYLFEGTVSILNPLTFSLEDSPVNVVRELKAEGVEGDDVLLLGQDITFTHAVAGVELPFGSSETYGIDRSTRENVGGYGDISRSGQFTFPASTEQETYSFWSSSAGKALPANFMGESTYEGLKVYSFKIDVKDIDAGIYEALGAPQTKDVYVEIKVEPVSGVPVYSRSMTTVKVAMGPDMVVPIFISDIEYTSETIDEMVDTAKSTRSLILWASVYGFWIVIGLGALLLIIGFSRASRA